MTLKALNFCIWREKLNSKKCFSHERMKNVIFNLLLECLNTFPSTFSRSTCGVRPRQLQNQLARNENERHQLEERLADAQTTSAELRRQKEQLSDSKSKLQQDLSNVEIKNAELEMTLKSLKGVRKTAIFVCL